MKAKIIGLMLILNQGSTELRLLSILQDVEKGRILNDYAT